ncbi:MAG: hypothetical protein NXI31_24495 [bacterium]|nr:hypothetical protein [bacterium]
MTSRWRLSIVAGAGLLAAAAAGAQQRVSMLARVLASGNAAPVQKVQAIASAMDLQWRLDELGWQERELPKVDFRRRRVVLLALGRGRGAPVRVTQVGRPGDRLVRVAGAADAAVVPERWVIVSVARAEADAPFWFETDCVLPDGAAGIRSLAEMPALGRRLNSHDQLERFPWPAGESLPQPLLATDRVTYERLVDEHQGRKGALATAMLARAETMDFRSSVLLLLPATVKRHHAEPPLRFVATASGVLLRHAGGPPLPQLLGGALPGRPSTTYRVYRVPRRAGVLAVERREGPAGEPRGRETRCWRQVMEFVVPRPRHQSLLPILRTCRVRRPGPELPIAVGGAAAKPEQSPHHPPRHATVCRRATTIAEWRDLRREVSEFSKLPVDWCDFEREDVVVVANPVGARSPLLRFDVSEEEGVDVVTISEVAPERGSAPCANGCAFIVPKRPAQLAIVWRDVRVPRAPVETTLRVFPGDGR